MRSTGSLTIPVGPMVNVSVDVAKATDSGSEYSLREVCSCHHEPFSRNQVCSVSGARRATEELAKSDFDGDTCERVYAAEVGGSFVGVSDDALAQIREATKSDALEVLAFVDRADAPMHTARDFHYLAPAKKVAKSEEGVEALHGLLSRGKALLGKWNHHGREHYVAIVAEDGALVMSTLRFPAEVREPTDRWSIAGTAPDASVDMLEQIAAVNGTEVPAEIEDRSVAMKRAVVEAALEGAELPKIESAPAETSGDLQAALEASLAAVRA